DGVSILGSAVGYSLTAELPELLRASVALGAALFAVAGGLLLLVGLLPAGRLPMPRWARDRLGEVGEPVRNLGRPAALLAIVLLGALIWSGILAQQAMLCRAVGIEAVPRAWLLLFAALGLA